MSMITVIVPVYKVEPYLRRCVDSILAQTYRNFELILVDDGSPDRCGEICEEYAKQDSRVIVLRQENGGLSAARNAGIDWAFQNSESKYLAFIDSDDWVLPEYLDALLVGVKKSGTVACCQCQEFRGQSHSACVSSCEWRIVPTREYWLQLGFMMTAWGKLYEKNLFKYIRYPVGRIHEDEYITHRILFQNEFVAETDAPLYCYYRRDDSITLSLWTRQRLDYIPGIEDQYTFFVAIKDEALIDLSARRLAHGYCGALQRTGENIYRQKLKVILRKHKLELIRHKTEYQLTCPVLFYTIWPFVRLYDVIKRRGVVGGIKQYCRKFG